MSFLICIFAFSVSYLSLFLFVFPVPVFLSLSSFISLIFVYFAYLRSFRFSSFISPELYSGIGSFEPPYIDQAWSISRLSLSSFLSPELYSGIGSSEPPYIDQAWSISRLLPFFFPFARMTIGLVDLPSLPFFFPFARMTFGYTATAAKLHFSLPLS